MDSTKLLEKVTAIRRDLHRHPELELDTAWTQSYIENILKDLDCTITHPIDHAIAAYFDNGKENTIAFRSDMDALPVQETCTHDFVSEIPGKMHACGHDGHMALLTGFALELNEFYRDLDCNVLLIYQPGEETPGGARPITETGLLEALHVRRIYGTHLWPTLEKGVVATRPGPLMAMATEMNVDITGRSVHAARWQEGKDAMSAAARYLLELYDAEAGLPDDVYRLLRFGRLESGSVRNALAGSARLEGTLRAFEEEVYWFLRNTMETKALELQRETGCLFSLEFNSGYPPVINDESLVSQAAAVLEDLRILEDPVMISEDFSFYQKRVPGVFFYLGTGTGIELHSPDFDFDEAILLQGIETYKKLVRIPF